MTPWYEGRACSACGTPLEQTRRKGKPLLRSESGATLEPHGADAGRLGELLRSHRPICWSCNLALAFRHDDPGGTAAPPPDRSRSGWWEGRPCALCQKPLRRGWFWQEKPRLVGESGRGPEVGSEPPGDGARMICTSCYYNRYGEVLALVRKAPLDASGAMRGGRCMPASPPPYQPPSAGSTSAAKSRMLRSASSNARPP